MLIELFGRNFGCFRDEFRLSMLATDIDRGNDRGIVRVKVEGDDEPLELLRCVAIYGPNASGKSTIIRAAEAFRHLMGLSRFNDVEAELTSYEPFALGRAQRQPVALGAKAVIRGQVYEYSIEFDQSRFLKETLVCLSSRPSEQVLIDRSNQEVKGKWREDELFQLLVKGFHPNALLLSLADSISPTLGQDIGLGFRALLASFEPTQLISAMDRETAGFAQFVSANPDFRGWLSRRLKQVDIGVVDLHTKRATKISPAITSLREQLESEDKPLRFSLLHSGSDGQVVPLHFSKESLGTRRFVALSPLFFFLAHDLSPSARWVDELDASLHPTLLRSLLHHFNCELTPDQVKGQLIFTTHDTGLMDGEAKSNVLRRDQVYFTEKDADGAARLYSLAEFKERQNLNIRRRYLQGRYGALPALGSFSE